MTEVIIIGINIAKSDFQFRNREMASHHLF